MLTPTGTAGRLPPTLSGRRGSLKSRKRERWTSKPSFSACSPAACRGKLKFRTSAAGKLPSCPLASFPRSSRSRRCTNGERKSVVSGNSVSVRVDLGGRRVIKKKSAHVLQVEEYIAVADIKQST